MATPTSPDITLYEKLKLNATLPPGPLEVGVTYTMTFSMYNESFVFGSIDFYLYISPNIKLKYGESKYGSPTATVHSTGKYNKVWIYLFSPDGIPESSNNYKVWKKGLNIICTIDFEVTSFQPNTLVTGLFLSTTSKNGVLMCDKTRSDLPCSSQSNQNGHYFTPGSTSDIYFNYDINVPIKNNVGRLLISNKSLPSIALIDDAGNGYYAVSDQDTIFKNKNTLFSCYPHYQNPLFFELTSIEKTPVAFACLSYSFGKAMACDTNGTIYYNPYFPNDTWVTLSGQPIQSNTSWLADLPGVSTQKAKQISFDGSSNEVCIIDSNRNCYYSNTLCIQWVPMNSPSTSVTIDYVSCSNHMIVAIGSDKQIYYNENCIPNNWKLLPLSKPIQAVQLSFYGYSPSNVPYNNLVIITNDASVYYCNNILSFDPVIINPYYNNGVPFYASYCSIQMGITYLIESTTKDIWTASTSLSRVTKLYQNNNQVKLVDINTNALVQPTITNTMSFQPTQYNTNITAPFKSGPSKALVTLKADMLAYIKALPKKHPNTHLTRLKPAFNYLLYQSPGQVKDSVDLMKQVKKTHGESAYATQYDANKNAIRSNKQVQSELDKLIQRYNRLQV